MIANFEIIPNPY